MIKTQQQEVFIDLIRLGIGHTRVFSNNQIDWLAIRSLAMQHGLDAIVIDGIEKLPDSLRPDKTTLLEWIGEMFQGYESRYELYLQTIAEVASFYGSHGYKMMLLKGYVCGRDWPKPEHRPYGDIDIWLFGEQMEADAILSKEQGVKIDKSHHHHTVFRWNNIIVENHYDFVNVHTRRSSAKIEFLFKDLGRDDAHTINVNGKTVYMPSPNLNALFLIRHLISHFTSSNINLRQILDWCFFVEKHTREVDWQWLLNVLEEYHMKDFFNCLNAICVDDLGFDAAIFPTVQYLPDLKDAVIMDVLDPTYDMAEPQGLIRRLVFKYKRWQGNAWKQRFCYKESRWESFWQGLWAHFLKPSSF